MAQTARTPEGHLEPVADIHAHFLPAAALHAAEASRPWHGTLIETGPSGTPVFVTAGRRTAISQGFRQDPSRRLEAMDAAGVDLQAVSIAPALYRYYIDAGPARAAAREANDELRDWAAQWPDRYTGLATLPLQDVDASVAELERAVRDLGLAGVALGTHVHGENWDSPRLLPVLHAAESLGAVVFFHPMEPRVGAALGRYHLRNLIGNPYETTVAIAALIYGGVLDRVPALKAVFAHGGGFACANAGRFDHGYRVRPEAGVSAERLPSDYLKGLFYDCLTHSGQALRDLLDTVGTGQVVLGTDYPADMGLASPVAWIDGCEGLSPGDRHAVLRGNAARLLP